MATLHITFRNAAHVGGSSLMSREPRAAQTITTSATSQASTITAQSGEVACLVVNGGAVFVSVGSAPTAASGSGDLMPSGSRLDLAGMNSGDKIAVIDA